MQNKSTGITWRKALLCITIALAFLAGIYLLAARSSYARLLVTSLLHRFGYRVSLRPPLKVERILLGHDQNQNGLDDLEDLVEGARKEISRKPTYRSAYYAGGYPPENEGVCTDLVWRAFLRAGYDLKSMVDKDILLATSEYPNVRGQPDPNIDFRRVPNLMVFFRRHATALTIEVKPWDAANLKEWQGGDIVVFGSGFDHIGIVSDRRYPDGVPMVIHHGFLHPTEDDALRYWPGGISGHFRIDPEKLAQLMSR